ncbi:MAG: hypothetical protein IJ265_03945 [Oscillospiraceae bacterium]|nr:hypothetical protein [Oscillospiraceae bacterium]
MKDVSRIWITRQHLKAFRKRRSFDGIKVYKNVQKDNDIIGKTAAVLYDIYLKCIS